MEHLRERLREEKKGMVTDGDWSRAQGGKAYGKDEKGEGRKGEQNEGEHCSKFAFVLITASAVWIFCM